MGTKPFRRTKPSSGADRTQFRRRNEATRGVGSNPILAGDSSVIASGDRPPGRINWSTGYRPAGDTGWARPRPRKVPNSNGQRLFHHRRLTAPADLRGGDPPGRGAARG